MKPRQPWVYPGNDLVLGYDEKGRAVILPYQDRGQHVYLPGRTGVGKSRLLNSFIRQDIANWEATRCPVVVFDPHGEVVASILNVLACNVRYRDRPVVFIDCTNAGQVIAWNPLQRHDRIDPAVSAACMLEAVAHATGELNVAQHPTTQRTLTTAFQAGIERQLTFTQLLELFDPRATAFRAEVAAATEDVRTRLDLERMNTLSKQRVEDETVALWNRLSGLTSTRLLRTMFSRAAGGFTFDWALEHGAIVLVSLATSGGTLNETHARLVCSLMLTNLWQAAQSRGKAAAGMRRPCYVYIDEAPFVTTPTIALQLAQARGFGLHFTIAAQATSQFEDFGGGYGRAIRKAVLRDTLTKVVFAQTVDPEDLEPLAREFALACYDPLLRKHTTSSFQTVGEEREEYWTIASNVTKGRSQGRQESASRTTQRSRSVTWSSTYATNSAIGLNHSRTENEQSITPEALAAETYGENEQYTWGESSSDGGNAQEGEATTQGYSTSAHQNEAEGLTHQQHVRWRPVIEEREAGVQFLSFEEQQHLWEQKLFRLYQGHALISRHGMPPVEIRTPIVKDPAYIDPAWLGQMIEGFRRGQDFWLSPAAIDAIAAALRDSVDTATRLGSYGRRMRSPVAAPDVEDDQ